MVESLADHPRAAAYLRRAHSGEFDLCVAAHAVAEMFAVLTTLPLTPRLTPGQTRTLIRRNVAAKAKLIALTRRDYEAVIGRLTEHGLTGGIVYDALHVRAAERAGAARLVTLNRRDFARIPSADLELEYL